MEACGSAHFWGREAQTRGHRVVLLPPHAVRPYALVAFIGDAARSVLAHAKRAQAPQDGLRAWALGRERARGHNKAAVALANKLARIASAVWRQDRPFAPRKKEAGQS